MWWPRDIHLRIGWINTLFTPTTKIDVEVFNFYLIIFKRSFLLFFSLLTILKCNNVTKCLWIRHNQIYLKFIFFFAKTLWKILYEQIGKIISWYWCTSNDAKSAVSFMPTMYEERKDLNGNIKSWIGNWKFTCQLHNHVVCIPFKLQLPRNLNW